MWSVSVAVWVPDMILKRVRVESWPEVYLWHLGMTYIYQETCRRRKGNLVCQRCLLKRDVIN